MLQIIERPQAAEDRIEIYAYLAHHASLKTADRFLQKIDDAVNGLALMPNKGRRRGSSDPTMTGLRVWSVPDFKNYLIFYLATNTTLEIVRVLHGARELDQIFPS